MAHYGLIIGIGLLVLVSATAWLLAASATRSIARFREEHHHSILERERP